MSDTPRITAVVAAAENNAIGKDNKLLWHLPNDLRFFKNSTWAMPVVMGRHSYESLGKALMGRYNIIITSKTNWHPAGIAVVHNLQEAIKEAEVMKTNEIFILGGGKVYQEALPITDRVLLTRVHAVLEADTFFPELDPEQWERVNAQDFYKDEKHAYDYTFETWERKNKVSDSLTV